jgi:D-aminopeptidase
MKSRKVVLAAGLLLAYAGGTMTQEKPGAPARPRARELGIVVGTFETGPANAITDVAGVRVGHVTLVEGEKIRTGVTAIVPHGGNLYRSRPAAAIHIFNAFGKLVGATQVQELGQLETPIVLTNTLSVWDAAAAVADWMLAQPGNENVRSINPVVGETNDSGLNDIRGRHVKAEHVRQALESAKGGAVEEGAVGAGTGTIAFGWKGGIGTSSRRVRIGEASYTVGVLVQTNYGGRLTIAGVPVWKHLTPRRESTGSADAGDGSCMIVVATDAPLDARQLGRLAARAMQGMARTGASGSHGSGDYVIAFSTTNRYEIGGTAEAKPAGGIREDDLSPLFVAAADATEESIYNSLLKATSVTGRDGRRVEALPIEELKALLAGQPKP